MDFNSQELLDCAMKVIGKKHPLSFKDGEWFEFGDYFTVIRTLQKNGTLVTWTSQVCRGDEVIICVDLSYNDRGDDTDYDITGVWTPNKNVDLKKLEMALQKD